MIQILIILCRHRQFLILKREMHCPGNQVVNDCKSRNCDNHSDKAEQASEEQNGKQHPETRKPRGVSQYLRSEDIAVKLLEQQVGLFARFGFVLPEHSVWMLLGGIVFIGVGAVFWWFGITYIVAKLKKWFNVRGIWLLNRIVGSVIIVLAIIGALSVLLTSYLHLPLLQIYN